MMSYNLKQNNVNPTLPSLLINGHNLTDQKIRNVMIRQLFVQELYPYLSNRLSILQFFSKKEAENLKSKFFKFPIAPKAKEVHFKILNKVYPSSEFLRNRFNLDHNNCLFCEENIETTDHLFYECKFVDVFWNDLYDWLFPKVPNLSILSKENILYGVCVQDSSHDLVINTIIILGKFFIHKNKFSKSKPIFSVFHKELCLYFSSLKCMRKKIAIKLYTLVEEFDLAHDP